MSPQEFCNAHPDSDPGGIFAVQIERVWAYLIRREAERLQPGGEDVFTLFRKNHLVPERLILSPKLPQNDRSIAAALELFRQRSKQTLAARQKDLLMNIALTPAGWLAACFIACIFPQRAQTEKTQLDLRLPKFLEFYRTLQALQERGAQAGELITDAARRFLNLSCPVPQEEFDELITELSAIPAMYHQEKEDEVRARKNGAALFLATCYPEQIERILAGWRVERPALRSVTRDYYRPPSCVDQKIHSLASPEAFRSASYLEYLTKRSAHDHMPQGLNGAEERLQEKVIEFWEKQHDKLTSGFPYFSFQSSFITWWSQVLRNWDWAPWGGNEDEVVLLPQPSSSTLGEEEEEEEWEVNFTTLRAWREGYRFLRMTFTRRNAGEDHEELRRALDKLWTHRLFRALSLEKAAVRIKEVAEEFVSLGGFIINNLSHRLRARNQAYSWARIKRRSNDAIYQRQQESRRKWNKKRPARGEGEDFDKEKAATFTVASLARAVPLEFTFLWAFTAQIFLRPRVDGRHADEWRFDRYARELWHWVTDPLFAGLVEHGARSGRLVDAIALRAMQSDGPFGALLSELMGFQNDDGLDGYLRRRDPASYAREEAAARQLIVGLIGSAGLCACGDAAMRRWKAMMDPINGAHWIIPVWYVTFVERIADDDSLLKRLVVDTPERGPVLRLAREMRVCGATAESGGGVKI